MQHLSQFLGGGKGLKKYIGPFLICTGVIFSASKSEKFGWLFQHWYGKTYEELVFLICGNFCITLFAGSIICNIIDYIPTLYQYFFDPPRQMAFHVSRKQISNAIRSSPEWKKLPAPERGIPELIASFAPVYHEKIPPGIYDPGCNPFRLEVTSNDKLVLFFRPNASLPPVAVASFAIKYEFKCFRLKGDRRIELGFNELRIRLVTIDGVQETLEYLGLDIDQNSDGSYKLLLCPTGSLTWRFQKGFLIMLWQKENFRGTQRKFFLKKTI